MIATVSIPISKGNPGMNDSNYFFLRKGMFTIGMCFSLVHFFVQACFFPSPSIGKHIIIIRVILKFWPKHLFHLLF